MQKKRNSKLVDQAKDKPYPFYSEKDIRDIHDDYGALLWELHQAAAYGDIDRVRECLDAGADINGGNPDFGATALMLASAGGYWIQKMPKNGRRFLRQ